MTSRLHDGAQKTAVIIDDFAEMAEFLRDLCGASGYQARVHGTAEALDYTAFESADVVLLDLTLPGMDGVELMRRLGGWRFPGPVVLVSGHEPSVLAAAASAGRAWGLNIHGILHKPFSIDEFEAQIAGLESDPPVPGPMLETATLQAAIDGNRIEPYFQPKIDLRELEVVGFAARTRLRLEDGEIVLPERFLGTAADSGLTDVLTDRMLILSLDAWREWALRGLDCTISVNIPVSRLQDVAFPDRLEELADLWAIDRRKLILEITETELLDHYGNAMDTVARLAMKRFSLAIDDFGTGFSSLIQLQRLPCVELKIASAFVQGMHHSHHCEVIVRKSIEIGRELGLTVTADGVRSQEDVDRLRAMHCDLGQGDFFSPPEPRDQINSAYIDGFAA